jgi:Flp pilus assembly protein TadG
MMSMAPKILTWVQQAAAQFRAKVDGFAAVEFALVAPIMIVMFVGTVELTEALSMDRRMTTIADSVADLVSQSASVTDAELADIATIADSLLGGADPTKLQVMVASIVADPKGNPIVDWSYGTSDNLPTPGSPYTELPYGMLTAGQGVIISEAVYKFKPPIAHFMLGETRLEESAKKMPRLGLKVDKK